MNHKHIALAGASLLLLGAGCIPSPTHLVENAVVNSALGTKGTANVNDNGVSFTGKDGQTLNIGNNVSIPSDFPKDVPILDGGTVAGVATSKDGSWISFTTDLSVDAAVKWYDDKLTAAGWEKQGTYSGAGTSTSAYTKDALSIGVVVSNSGSDGKTTVMVTEGQK